MKVQQYSENKYMFYDIYILIESIENSKHLQALQKATESHDKKPLKPLKKDNKSKSPVKDKEVVVDILEEDLMFDDIKESLNGWARIISYKAIDGDADKKCELESVVEGKFKNGLKEGYCRGISAINGSSCAGFNKQGIPHGKWSAYKPSGEFSHPEGLYEGTTCQKNMEIKTFNEGIMKST